MALIPTHGGPISEYLKMANKTQATFDNEVRRGDPAAASVFAAEVVFGAIQDLIQTIENQQRSSGGTRLG